LIGKLFYTAVFQDSSVCENKNMNKNIYRRKLIMLYGDILIIASSFYFAPFVRYKELPDLLSFFGFAELAAIFVYVSVLYIFDFYNIEEKMGSFGMALKFFIVILMVNIIIASLFYLFHLRPYSSVVLFISGFLTLILLFIWRFVLIDFSGVAANPLKVIILGAGNSGRTLYDLLKSKSEYLVVGFVDDDRARHERIIDGIPVLGGSDDLINFVNKYNVNKVIVCISKEIGLNTYPKLVEAKFNGVVIYEMPTFYEKIAGKIPVLHVSDVWMGYAGIHEIKKDIYNINLKNIMDITMALICLIITMPLVILTAIFIKMESKGPVVYSQIRMGLNEKPFIVYKFRSMYSDVEKKGAVWAQENDPRITNVGKIIRFLRIDELPQLWNVLKGEMSFVGPRPEQLEFVRQLEKEIPYYMLRHNVKPGITGWAQVNYNYGASMKDALEKLQYDLYYIKNRSLLLDVYIMVRTIRVIIFGIGAR
jgi:sugar transferase (PEP-CTERM system associated)